MFFQSHNKIIEFYVFLMILKFIEILFEKNVLFWKKIIELYVFALQISNNLINIPHSPMS